jgi:mxaJ protein
MCSPYREASLRALCAALIMLLSSGPLALAAAVREPLRVCADPDNPPFSRLDGSGFENRIAVLAAEDLGRPLQYAWLPDRRGFVRKTLGARICDVILGVPVGLEQVRTTRAYYQSGYVFVQRRSASPILGLADPRLATWRIGVPLIGQDMAVAPPARALAHRGIVANVKGYMLRGDPPAARRMVEDVARGALDLAIVWGPQAGPFVAKLRPALRVDLIPTPAGNREPFEFAIAMGTRADDAQLRGELDGFLSRRQPDIDRVLDAFDVPRAARPLP